VQGLTAQAADQAADVMNDVRSQLRERADAEAHRAAGAIGGLGRDLCSMASHADQDGPAVQWVREAGVRSQRLADRLEREGTQGVVDDVQRFARRRPGAFLAGAGFAGLVVGRMLRNTASVGSSSSDRSTWSASTSGEIDLRGDGEAADRSSSIAGLSLESPENLSGAVPNGMRTDSGGTPSDG